MPEPPGKRTGPEVDTPQARPNVKATGKAPDISNLQPGAASGRACAWCRGELPRGRRRFCCDDHRRRGQKRERVIEDDSYAAGVVRLIRKMGIRASADLEALKWLAGAAEHARGALAVAVDGCRARGYSDTEIGMALGYDKPNARQAVGARFGRRKQAADCSDDRYSGQPESGAVG